MQPTTSTVIMVRPRHFYFNPETAESNTFQQQMEGKSEEEILAMVREEFDQMVEALRAKGIRVLVFEDTSAPPKPDAVFPNNWVIFHHTGQVVLFPMEAKSRRAERRNDIIEALNQKYEISEVINYARYEKRGQYLEGTGSLVFDHPSRVAYACLSPRTHPALVDKFCQAFDYQPITFHAHDREGRDVYHTNVMMCVGSQLAVVCLESISDEPERKQVTDSLQEAGKEIVDISLDQMHQFAGNMIELQNDNGQAYLLMSSQAYRSLQPNQIQTIEKYASIIHTPLDTIEQMGGGSARCMVAEVFLEPKIKDS